MKKMLYFALVLSTEIKKANEIFCDFEEIHIEQISFYNMCRGVELLMKDKRCVYLDEIWDGIDEDELDSALTFSCKNLKDYVQDENTVGIIFSDFLYEVLYDHGTLGDKFRARHLEKEKNETIKKLVETVYKIADAFQFELEFLDGRIYINENKMPLEDGSFICENIAEVEAVCKLKKGASILDARESSGMSKEEFESFIERLKQHEWKQTLACEE